MRHICSRCRLTSEDGNLWCQEADCPAGDMPVLFNYGDMLGNIRILELRRVLPTAAIYKADREGTPYYIKIANRDPKAELYLQREAELWWKITHSKNAHDSIAHWVDHGAVNPDAHGMVTVKDNLRYYVLLEYQDGDFLEDVLLDNAQPWHEHVAWFIYSLAEALLAFYGTTGCLHLNLSPRVLMVVKNKAGVPQPLLMDMGLGKKPNDYFSGSELVQYQGFMLPAYTPRQLVEGGALTEAADVHSLGLLLYEMLSGEPAYPYLLRKSDDIFQAVRRGIPQRLRRDDLNHPPRRIKNRPSDSSMLTIVESCLNPTGYSSVAEAYQALYTLYGPVTDKRANSFNAWATATMVFAAISGVLFIMLMLVLAVVDV